MSELKWIEEIDSLSEITIPALLDVLERVDVNRAWLEDNLPDELPDDSYVRHVVHKGDEYEVILAAWPVGVATLPHDHGTIPSIGAVKVLQGRMFNQIFRRYDDDRIEPVHKECIEAGELAKVTPGLVHVMGNDDPNELSVSLHVYSPLLEDVTYWEADSLQPRPAVLGA